MVDNVSHTNCLLKKVHCLSSKHSYFTVLENIQKKREELRKIYEDLFKKAKQRALEIEIERMKQNFEQNTGNQKSESLWQQILRWFGFSET